MMKVSRAKISFSYYAAIVKNLRGVILFKEFNEELFTWLLNRFKYRDLGASTSIWNKIPDKYRNILKLDYPTKDLYDYMERLLNMGLDYEALESLSTASTYISPLILVGNHYEKFINENSVSRVLICRPLDTKSWKLHLRIVDYVILDFYRDSIEESIRAIECIKRGDYKPVDEILDKRSLKISRDVKRFWRISCRDGKPFIYYIDLLKLVYEMYLKGMIDKEVLQYDIASALAILPVVVVKHEFIEGI